MLLKYFRQLKSMGTFRGWFDTVKSRATSPRFSTNFKFLKEDVDARS